MKFKRTYTFAFWSSFYLAVLSVAVVVISYLVLFPLLGNWAVLITAISIMIISFFVIQYRAEHFIYRRVKKIYDEVSLLDVKELKRRTITTNMETLSEHVKEFVEDKRNEIQSLTERDSFRKEFLGNVAHELKTPLFTVQGYILTLLEGAAEDKKIRTKYLKRANKGVDRLSSIVKDLDMIAKLETNKIKLNIETFDIIDVIQNVFDLFEMKAKKRNITLKLDKQYEFPVHVKGDIEKIEQVIINLVVNSIKYGKTNGLTSICVQEYNSNKYLIKVIDNGEGIKQKHIPRLFERFYRVDRSRSRVQGGSGLGLSIVKHIIEAHNETILLKSTYGKGSEFSFTIEKAK